MTLKPIRNRHLFVADSVSVIVATLVAFLVRFEQPQWIADNIRLVAFYLALAVLNEVVWRLYGTDTWVNFRTFVLPAANFLFIMAQVPLFQRYAAGDTGKDA